LKTIHQYGHDSGDISCPNILLSSTSFATHVPHFAVFKNSFLEMPPEDILWEGKNPVIPGEGANDIPIHMKEGDIACDSTPHGGMAKGVVKGHENDAFLPLKIDNEKMETSDNVQWFNRFIWYSNE